ncbi:MAG: ATP-binding protein [Gemmatimonas sp.]
MLKSGHRAIVGFAGDGVVEFANAASAHVFGRDPRELVGLSIERLFPQTFERLSATLDTCLWSIGRRCDGTPFPARLIVEPVEAGDGRERYVVRIATLAGDSAADPAMTAIINGVNDAATLWDHADRLILWNDRALEFHAGISGVIRLGTPFEEFVSRCVDAGTDAAALQQFVASNVARHRRATGVREEISIGARHLLVAERRLPGGAVVRLETDITDQKLREIELRAAKDKAEAASRSKSTFLANMSHELRTPLNAVIGFSDILKTQMLGPVGNPKYLEYANHISDSGAHLLHLVNYILDLSRVEAGRYELRREALAPGELVADVLRLVRLGADKSNLELHTTVAADLPAIMVDRRALRQVLLNILSNAIKFTPAGGRVSVSATARDGRVAIAVADTGIGIAKEDLPRLAHPFEQAGDAYARSQPGSGLGLAITKQLVELHGGSLTIDSAIGEGTTVVVALPISDGQAELPLED